MAGGSQRRASTDLPSRRISTSPVRERTTAVIPVGPTSLASGLTVRGRSVLDETLSALRTIPEIGSFILALEAVEPKACLSLVGHHRELGLTLTRTLPDRWRAIRAATALDPDADVVLLHEPNRPLTSPARIRALLERARELEAVVAAVPVWSSLKRVASGQVAETVPREAFRVASGPWALRREVLIRALEAAVESVAPPADELELLTRAGVTIHAVEGHRFDIRVISAVDAQFAELALERRGGFALQGFAQLP